MSANVSAGTCRYWIDHRTVIEEAIALHVGGSGIDSKMWGHIRECGHCHSRWNREVGKAKAATRRQMTSELPKPNKRPTTKKRPGAKRKTSPFRQTASSGRF